MPMRTYTGTDSEDGDDDGEDSEEKMLRTQTVDDFLVLLEKPKLTQVLAQVRTTLHFNALHCTVLHGNALLLLFMLCYVMLCYILL